jgi:hypothetical protein
MKFGLLGIVGLLLLTGCSSSTVSQEQAVKLLEYEKCLEMQQGITDSLNRAIGELYSKDFGGIFDVYSKQAEAQKDSGLNKRFEFHLKNCLSYRP